MVAIVDFLGLSPEFPPSPVFATMLAVWLDSVHYTVLASARGKASEHPARTMMARAKLFILKFARTSKAKQILVEGIRPLAALFTDWT